MQLLGGISQMRLGNGRWETAKFNNRMQVTELGLGSSATDAGVWKTQYEYGELDANGNIDASKNTGNIAQQTLTVPGSSFVQSYTYDSLYRLTEAVEKTGSTTNWSQQFGYDRYGNRTSLAQNIGGITKNTTPAVDANTNRFTSTDFGYDANGNIVGDIDEMTSLPREFIFNGDNKQTEVKRDGVTIGRYYYDGEGKRVKKVTDTETTVFVYSGGKLIAEYSTELSQTPSVNYTTADHLGSPRVITNELGQVRSRRDFMPFGEELYAGVGTRTGDTGLKYSSSTDNIRQKFTGYQKDKETGLDFAEARMYENRFGRFTAVDPLLASGKSVNPQTFNRYIYVGNRPLTLIDPKGLDWYFLTVNGMTTYRWSSDNKNFDDGDKASIEGWNAVEFGFGGQYRYRGCFDADCTSRREAVLYQLGGWDWVGSFSFSMRQVWRDTYRDAAREIESGFEGTRRDINKIADDPLGPYGLGNPHLGMMTGGTASTFFQGFTRFGQFFSRSARTSNAVTDTASTASKVVQFEQYSLRAAKDGMYPVMQRGSAKPIGSIFLKEGDVWKFGQTMRGPARYSATWLEDTGLQFVPEFKTPSFKDVLQMERQQILQYEQQFGKLPAGNKIRR